MERLTPPQTGSGNTDTINNNEHHSTTMPPHVVDTNGDETVPSTSHVLMSDDNGNNDHDNNSNSNDHDHDNDNNDHHLLSTTPRSKFSSKAAVASVQEYIGSYRFVELMVSLSFVIAGTILESDSITPHQRPIPYQYIEDTGTYIVDQTYAQEFQGETISGEYVLIVY